MRISDWSSDVCSSDLVLHAVNADTRNYPASLTKMMTLYLVFEALEKGTITRDQALPVSKRSAGMAPSPLGLDVGDSISVEDAILALTTKSANDAAVRVAERLGATRPAEHTSSITALMSLQYAV